MWFFGLLCDTIIVYGHPYPDSPSPPSLPPFASVIRVSPFSFCVRSSAGLVACKYIFYIPVSLLLSTSSPFRSTYPPDLSPLGIPSKATSTWPYLLRRSACSHFVHTTGSRSVPGVRQHTCPISFPQFSPFSRLYHHLSDARYAPLTPRSLPIPFPPLPLRNPDVNRLGFKHR
ncbi:hypothetical protein FA13DRAFT_1157789 [Coprinellus micaceus]|jgi:hypothetical protein|uniref:Uncharacterized protein n=1 Tax=Coprinellus micaceus TaxID=71717 RepID=A0A4Y7SUE8_COPMI|nr:hypothetical protein FA13DRAFT_1157789 [Coprinellus micaceus]